ncbi:MAG: tetratricopeptide repeat protein, partial [Thermoanaerobaculia bacterium]
LDPHDLVSQRVLLAALERLGRTGEVEARVRALARELADPHLLLSAFAVLLREEGLPRPAARFFEEALRLDPRRLDAWVGLGNLAFDRAAYDEALRHYGRALELNPEALEPLTNCGKIHAIRKEYRQAVPILEKAIVLRPDLAPALSTLGGVLIEEGDLARAEDLLARALAAATARETLLSVHGNLGILFLRKREPEKARASFEKVLELDPADPRARSALERLSR